MEKGDWLAQRFEENRPHLRAVAYRMLGSAAEAEDAVQNAWFKLNRAETDDVKNLGGWLTTVVARVCLDMLRSRTSRREVALDNDRVSEPVADQATVANPEEQAILADAVGPALLVVLDSLSPAERLAFVLHDMFDLPFDEIASIVGRSPAAARQLASRARRRVRGLDAPSGFNQDQQREVVAAFLRASREGDFAGLLEVLDPDIEFRADPEATRIGGVSVIHGARDVAESFDGLARAARLVLVNGVPGAVWAPGGKPKVVLEITITNGKISGIDAIADPGHLEELDLMYLDS